MALALVAVSGLFFVRSIVKPVGQINETAKLIAKGDFNARVESGNSHDEISELCGTICTSDNRSRRLISVSELQRLDKEKGEALIMHARQYPIITEIADIDMYPMFNKLPGVAMKRASTPNLGIFSIPHLYEDVKKKKREAPFSKPHNFMEDFF